MSCLEGHQVDLIVVDGLGHEWLVRHNPLLGVFLPDTGSTHGLKMDCRLPVSLIAFLLTLSSAHAEGQADFFEKKIRPVLAKHCFRCHSKDAKPLRAKLQLDTAAGIQTGGQSGGVLGEGDAEKSWLLKALLYKGPKMPPNGRLPETVIADFRKWLESGARLPDDRIVRQSSDESEAAGTLWAFSRPKPVPPPEVGGIAAGSTEIDRFVVARLEQKSLAQGKLASKAVLLRRLSFDLIGLLPTLTEQKQFYEDDSEKAYEKLVDRLLASPHFGERWGRHWLDLARFSESNGADRNVIFQHAWRYARYVITAFNEDRPFDEFVREQIAGDLLPSTSQEQKDRQLVATGFLTFGPKTFMETKAERFRMDRVDEQIDVVSRSVLGLTISCARCHDHKFDPISTQDYYALAGIFRSTYLLSGPAAPAGNQYGHDRPLQPIGKGADKLHGPAQNWQDDVAEQVKVRNKARSDRYRVLRKKAAQENKRKMSQSKADQGDEAAAKMVAELTAEIETLAKEIAEWDEKIKKLDEKLRETQDNPPPLPDYAMAVRDDETIEDSRVRIAGEFDQLDESVPRGVPTALSESPIPITADQSGRVQLAEWLTSEDNPLTPRVAVNRIWKHLFGGGLVRSVDNFGRTGEKPTHPQLLDWLAVQFMKDGWSTKKMIRRIVLSRTYRLASSVGENLAAESDPENRLLWRQNQRRLEAEPLRDAMLAVSGELDRTPPEASPVSQMKDRELNDRVVITSEQKGGLVRSVYLPIARQSLPPMLKAFGFADPSLVIGQRSSRTTPGQQLFLLNDPFVMDRAAMTARRVLKIEADDDLARIKLLYRTLFAREPTETEQKRSIEFVAGFQNVVEDSVPRTASVNVDPARVPSVKLTDSREVTWAYLCHALLASGEFLYVE